jgi:hypothetical protein
MIGLLFFMDLLFNKQNDCSNDKGSAIRVHKNVNAILQKPEFGFVRTVDALLRIRWWFLGPFVQCH